MSDLEQAPDHDPTAGADREPAGRRAATSGASPERSSSRGRKLLVLVAALGIVAVAGSVGGWWWYTHQAPASGGALSRVSDATLVIDPPPPFSPGAGQLGPAQLDDTRPDKMLDRLPAEIAALKAGLQLVSIDGAAPPPLVVVPGSRQTNRASGADARSRHERWELRFPIGSTLETYARQLDFFGIELGVVGGSDDVIYLYRLSNPVPQRRSSPGKDERRLYLTWNRGSLRDADLELATKAKVDTKGKIIAHFCPEGIEKMLAELEDSQATRNGLKVIRKTVFGIMPDAKGFKFYVIEQQ